MVVDPRQTSAPTTRFVPGGHSYADAAAAWRDGRVLARRDRNGSELAATDTEEVDVTTATVDVRQGHPPPVVGADTRTTTGTATLANAKPKVDQRGKTREGGRPRQSVDASTKGSGSSAVIQTACGENAARVDC